MNRSAVMPRITDARRGRLLLAGLVVAHLIAISRQVDGGGGSSLLDRAVYATLSPLQAAAAAGVRGVKGLWLSYVDLRGVRGENGRLQDRLREVETRMQERQRDAEEAKRLRELLELREVLPHDTLVAQVIVREALPWFRSVTIDKGTRQGVALNAAVISPTGVVGRVIGVGPQAAKVQLLLDQQSGLGARIERSRVTGVVSGQLTRQASTGDASSGDLLMKFVPMLADVVEGDVVVTSGLDRMFPPGLVVGRVRSVVRGSGLFKDVRVAASADFDRLEEVLVIRDAPPQIATTEEVK
ncbi:MAG: rod shape-determining protein MreC [Vicinamibacteria bacterium]